MIEFPFACALAAATCVAVALVPPASERREGRKVVRSMISRGTRSRQVPYSFPPVLVAAICLLVGCETHAAQSTFRFDSGYLMDTWETEDGLPENSATAIVQTPDGYLWFGTFDGLVRFNGVEFTVLTPATTPQLPSAGIVNLHLDQRGRLWVSTYRGLVVRDGTEWRQMYPIDGWEGDFARTFTERANGDLLVTAFNGRLFEFSGERFVELPAPPGEKGHGYFGGVDEDGHWWAVQNKFIGRWEDGRWVRMISPPEVPRDSVGCATARDGGLWLALGNELRKLSRGVEISRIALPKVPGGIWSLSEDSLGNVWIATHDQGVCRVTTNGVMTRWSATDGGSDHGRYVFEDREKNLWMGTSGDGLMRLTPRRFHHFELESGRKGLVVQSVWPAAAGGLWAGTYGRGLFHLGETGVTHVAFPDRARGPSYVQSVLEDRAGRLWIGSFQGGLWLLEKDRLRQFPATETGGNNALALFEDSRGRIWVSGGGGIVLFDGTERIVFETDQGLPMAEVTSFAEDASGAIWCANGSGVFRRERERLFAEVKDNSDQPIRGVGCLLADADGSMWLGTSDLGLLRWKAGWLAGIDVQPDFPDRPIRGLVEDDHGFVWMTFERGIVRVRRSDLHAAAEGRTARLDHQVFDANDGLRKAEFTSGRQPVAARDSGGRLWFATQKGVATVNPAALQLNSTPPPVVVEELAYHRKSRDRSEGEAIRRHGVTEVLTRLSPPFRGPAILQAGSRRLEIRYAGLSFSAPEKVRFQVKLEGLDAGWQDAGYRRAAYYHELPPGDYVFRVRAANNDGVWNEAGASLAFAVQPFLWQTQTFRAVAMLLLIGSGGGAVWWWAWARLRRATEREKTAREMRDLAGRLITAQEEERTRLARELHDDLSQRLALLSVDLELFGQKPLSAPDQINTRMHELSSQVKTLSSEVHRLSHELHPAKLEQLGLAAAVRGFCKELSAAHQMAVHFEAGVLPPAVPDDVALCLYRIAQEALQNVVKHSGATSAQVGLITGDNEIRLTIVDDGAGFDPQAVQSNGSLGLVSMRERVRLVQGRLSVESRAGQGTRVEVRVPLSPLN